MEGCELTKRTLRQPFLTSPGRFPLFGFPLHTWLFVKTSALQLTKQTIGCEFFLRNTKSFLDIVVHNLDFHCTS